MSAVSRARWTQRGIDAAGRAISLSWIRCRHQPRTDGANWWGRVENVDRTNELLFRDVPIPPNLHEAIIGRVQAYTFGFDRDFMVPHLAIAPGAQLTVYSTPDAIRRNTEVTQSGRQWLFAV